MKQTLAVARSLGRAGLHLVLADRRDPAESRRPPAFSSRWAGATSFLADFDEDPDDFAAGVVDLVLASRPAVVVPASDQSIACLRPWRTEIERHTRLAMGSEAALKIAVDKHATLALASELGIDVPKMAMLDDDDDLAAIMDGIGYPAVIKPSWSWSRGFAGRRLVPTAVLNIAEASVAVSLLRRAGAPVLVQELLIGEREGLSLFRANNRVLAEFAHVSVRTTPMLGGACAVRESIPMPPDLRKAAVALITAMDLDGYSQIEFRRDLNGRPVLMEVNPRLSGSIELAWRSGIDFPLMIWRWASGGHVQQSSGYRSGVRLRWLTGDGRWLLETLRAPGRPDSTPAGSAIAAFARDFLRGTGYDFVDAEDPLPALAEANRVLRKVARKMVKRPNKHESGHNVGALWYQEK